MLMIVDLFRKVLILTILFNKSFVNYKITDNFFLIVYYYKKIPNKIDVLGIKSAVCQVFIYKILHE